MKYSIYFFTIIALLTFATSCEDTITVDTGFETPQLVVDAWLNDEARDQTIILSLSQDYFDSSFPTGIDEASVTVTNGDDIFSFEHTSDGRYVWSSTSGATLGVVGDNFDLEIIHDGTTYSSTTTMFRVPEIDSIRVFFEEESAINDEGLFAEAYATDFVGEGDAYWMRAYKNDTLLNKPSELNTIWDATFDPGSGLDGVTFITPIRGAIMPTDDDGATIPYLPGDKIDVELLSISPEAFRFLGIVFEQTTNGDNGIFALPLANARGNVVEAGTDNRILGFFNVAAVSTATKIVEE